MSRVGSNLRDRLQCGRQYYWYIIVTIILGLCTFSNLNFGESLLLDYTKYTSDKYQIEFNYPSDWTLTEKTDNPQQPRAIMINGDNVGRGQIGISYSDNLMTGFGTTDLATSVVNEHKKLLSDIPDFGRTILNPSFTTINGHLTGTFLLSFAEGQYETDPLKGVWQYWTTFNGGHGYTIVFVSTPDSFLTPDYTEVRDQFINSIKFLGGNGQLPSSPTN